MVCVPSQHFKWAEAEIFTDQVQSIFVGLGSETGGWVEVPSFIASGVSLATLRILEKVGF